MGERYKNKGKHTAPQTRIINIARVGASYNAKSMVINQLETNEIDIMFTFFCLARLIFCSLNVTKQRLLNRIILQICSDE